MKSEKKGKKDYINNADFLQCLIDHQYACDEAESNGLPQPRLPNYIGECFLKIADGLSHKPNFINYTYRDEMVCDGIENCIMYHTNFNPHKYKNPFAYFTQIVYYAFLRRIQKEKKQQYIKYKSASHIGIEEEQEIQEFMDVDTQFEIYNNLSAFMENFEKIQEKKRNTVKKPKGLEQFFDQ